jgi:hypothetical protein
MLINVNHITKIVKAENKYLIKLLVTSNDFSGHIIFGSGSINSNGVDDIEICKTENYTDYIIIDEFYNKPT